MTDDISDIESAEMDTAPTTRRERFFKHFRRDGRPRRRRLRKTAVLPAALTLGNAIAGFASIHFATKEGVVASGMQNLTIAAWLIAVAMVFDMLDGRVARMTRHTSDFGGQLDSLSDVVSFGVAPAVLLVRTVIYAVRFPDQAVASVAIERAFWCVGAVYLACTALRLARFNVENEPDESAHMDFRGLPSPAAAGVIGALVLLAGSLASDPTTTTAPAAGTRLVQTLTAIVLPVMGLAAALLMVSRFRYPHLVNYLIRGKRPFNYIVKLVIVTLAVVVWPYITLAVFAVGFALCGPVLSLVHRIRDARRDEATG